MATVCLHPGISCGKTKPTFCRIPNNNVEVAVDVEQIPDAIPRGNFKPVIFHGQPTNISFALETTVVSNYFTYFNYH